MNISCDVIRDLLPLYSEKMVSEDTKDLVEVHLHTCDKCRVELESCGTEMTIPRNAEIGKLIRIRNKIHYGVIWLVLRNCILVASIVLGTIVMLTRPRVMSAEEANITVIENEEGIFIDFGEEVDVWRMKAGVNQNGDAIEYIAVTAFDWILDLSHLYGNYPERDIAYFDACISDIPDYFYMEIGSDCGNTPIIRGEKFLTQSPYGSPFFKNLFVTSLGISILFVLFAWISKKGKLSRWLSDAAVFFAVLGICTLAVTGNNWLLYESVGVAEYSIMIITLTGMFCVGLFCWRKVRKYKKQGVLL